MTTINDNRETHNAPHLTTTEPPAQSVPSRTLFRRYDNLLAYLVLACIALADFFNFWVAFQRFDRNASQAVALVLVGAMTLTAVALMMFASHYWRKGVDHHVVQRVAIVLPMVAIWLALGIAAFAMRMTLPPQVSSGFGAATTASSSSSQHNMILASLMFVLYLGAGIVSWVIEAKLENPERKLAYRARGSMWTRWAQRRAARKAQRLAVAQGTARAKRWHCVSSDAVGFRQKLAEAEANVAALVDEQRVIVDNSTHVHASLRAQSQELKSYARLRLAQGLKQPAKTSGVFTDVRTHGADYLSVVGDE